MKGKKGDLLAVALVLAAAIGLGVWVTARAAGADNAVAVIYRDGEVVRRIDLNAVPQTFVVRGPYRNEIAVEPGRIRVLASDCPGGDCVRSGWVARPGKGIVCLPNRLEIRLEGGDADVDATTR